MPKILHFTFGTPHTHIYRYPQTHAHIQTHIQMPFSHFALLGSFGIPQTYTCRHSDIYVQTLTHRYRYTETHAYLCSYVAILGLSTGKKLCVCV